MKKIISLFSLIFCLISLAFGQTDQGHITGTIYDHNNESVPYASVAVYDSSQTTVVTGASSDSTGTFNIEVDPGEYVLKVTFLSFKPYVQPFEVAGGATHDFGTIILTPTSEMMDELVVRRERSQMELSFDRRVFNVGRDITSLGGSAVNVLNNVPSISTDIDGNISLRGNQSVRVLINGKPSSMVSGDVDALRSIPANMIQKVEIITNPSSKYAAEGSGGIINIVLRKDQRLGLNGSATVGTGYPEEYEGSVNLNYRRGNINWFMDLGVDYRSEPESGSSFQRFAGPDTSYMYREQTEATESEIDGDFRLGADIHLSENEVLTASSYISLEKEENDEDVRYTDFKYAEGAFGGDVIERIKRDNVEDQNQRNFDFNLDYENKIDGNDHKLTADASFDISREKANTNIEETIVEGGTDPLMQRARDTEEEMDLRFNAEYKRPLGEKGKLEAGLRTDTEWMDTGYRAETLENGTWVPEAAFSQNFLYTENVNAAFAILGGEFGNFSGQIGLRAENTNIRTEIKETGDVNEQNYWNVFPSVFLNYSFNDQQSVQVSYSRRLRRPWSRSLIPFVDFDDPRSQWTGNPNLTPEFSNSYEVGYLHYWESGSLLTSLYHRYRTDVIERITQIDSVNNTTAQVRKPVNLASEKAWGIELSVDQEIVNRLTLSGSANFYQSHTEGTYRPEGRELLEFDSESQNFRSRMRLRWEIIDGLNYQASMRYRGPSDTPQGRRDGMLMTDTGISYDILNEKAKLSLSVRDLFDSQSFSNTVTTDGNPKTDFYSEREFSWSTRTFSLNFQYFFGDTNKRSRSRSRNGGGGGMEEGGEF
ncbi:MAG TPA: outer membrane beta-barrel family protein [Fodinibius sp.]|nr:outer membrane beta-barrel family protein [Fodinibius sp.]